MAGVCGAGIGVRGLGARGRLGWSPVGVSCASPLGWRLRGGVGGGGGGGGGGSSTRVHAKKKRIKKDQGPSADEVAQEAEKKDALVDPKKVRKMGTLKKVKREEGKGEKVREEDLPPVKEGWDMQLGRSRKKAVRIGWKSVKVSDPDGPEKLSALIAEAPWMGAKQFRRNLQRCKIEHLTFSKDRSRAVVFMKDGNIWMTAFPTMDEYSVQTMGTGYMSERSTLYEDAENYLVTLGKIETGVFEIRGWAEVLSRFALPSALSLVLFFMLRIKKKDDWLEDQAKNPNYGKKKERERRKKAREERRKKLKEEMETFNWYAVQQGRPKRDVDEDEIDAIVMLELGTEEDDADEIVLGMEAKPRPKAYDVNNPEAFFAELGTLGLDERLQELRENENLRREGRTAEAGGEGAISEDEYNARMGLKSTSDDGATGGPAPSGEALEKGDMSLEAAKAFIRQNKRKDDVGVRFDDVAGIGFARAELEEVVDYFSDPEKFTRIGARPPRGVLLCGPPGTGKTLLAKAVAGEAGVPFFSMAGSEFVEMFVGVGAARVRELFRQAKEKQPSVVFIDEIDALGRQRGLSSKDGGTDEREATLNQLLTEMDGFDDDFNVIVIAATNRPDILDKALMRAGRFDRQIVVSRPDLEGRVDILKVHARSKDVDPSVDWWRVARRTFGMSGAELENVVNVAALIAARHDRTTITLEDLDNARAELTLGPLKRTVTTSEEARRVLSVHEAGKALVAELLSEHPSIQQATIVPREGTRSASGTGTTLLAEGEDEMNSQLHMEGSQITILARMCVAIAGRVAQELMLGPEGVTVVGVEDNSVLTDMCHELVTDSGWTSAFGVRTVGYRWGGGFAGGGSVHHRDYSRETADEIENLTLRAATYIHQHVAGILEANSGILKAAVAHLAEHQVLYSHELHAIMDREGPAVLPRPLVSPVGRRGDFPTGTEAT